MKCKICNKELTELSLKVHVKKQHSLTFRNYQIKFGEIKLPKCLYCEKLLEDMHPNVKFCNNICKLNHSKEKKYGNIKDIPTCKICGMKSLNLTTHVNKLHNLSIPEYMKKYNLSKLDVFHQSYLDKLGLEGEKNPAFNHGGKYSPFSKNFIYYDEKKRQEVIKKANENRTYNTRIEYYLEEAQANYDLADWLLKQRQCTFSKEICIEKYGKEKGLKVWKDRQDGWQNTLKSKPQEEINRINRNKTTKNYHSIYISKPEKELQKLLKCNKQIDISGYKFDLGRGKKLIEYNGDYWHCNPKIYPSDYYHELIDMTAKEKWSRDKKKIDYAKSKGYDVLVIWEKDYKSDPQKVIGECMEFINGAT